MPLYHAPTADFQFLLKDWLGLDAHYQKLGIGDFDSELASEIIAQGAKFALDVVAPLNREGDEEGCHLENGSVTTPKGFADAYQEYVANGWNAMLGSADYDGQDLPYTMAVPVHEMLNAANLSWRLTTMLTESAVLAVTKHASDDLKNKYLAKLISGEWTGTMNLTEPHAGTDLSLLNTKAEPQDDGSYKITGNKIFITAGDQDWSSNIVHLVLARLPDAPKGVKGISLFLVPKFLLDDNNEPGEANQVSVGSIEHKMGIKGSPTCVMNYDGAKGWLVGEEGRGVPAIIEMVAMTRFDCMIGSASGQRQAVAQAVNHAAGRAAFGKTLLDQPLMRNVLADLQLEVEGSLAIAMRMGEALDQSTLDPSNSHESLLLRLGLPAGKYWICKRTPFHAYEAMECLGGNGVTEDFIMARLYREAPINAIWEGSGNVQALDMLRALGKTPAVLDTWFAELAKTRFDKEVDSAEIQEFIADEVATGFGRTSSTSRLSPSAVTEVLAGGMGERRGGGAGAAVMSRSRSPAGGWSARDRDGGCGRG